MAEIRTVTTLRSKQREIENAIVGYEKRLAQARADLAHVNACIALFEATGERDELTAYTDVYRLFARGEQTRLCKAALSEGPKDTPELALIVVKAKGLDAGDSQLVKAITARLIHALRAQQKRGLLKISGKRRGRLVWRLP